MTLSRTAMLGIAGAALGILMLTFAFATAGSTTHGQTPGTTGTAGTTTRAAGTATTGAGGSPTVAATRSATASSGAALTPSAAAGLPSTGSGSGSGGDSTIMWLVVGGLAIAATGAGVAAVGVRRR